MIGEIKTDKQPSNDPVWDELYGVRKKDLNREDMLYSIANILFELARISVSSLLVIFIPQNCGDAGTCSLKENFEDLSDLNLAAIIWNFLTLATMIFLYYIIYKREKYLIYRLDEDPKVPKTNITIVFKEHPEIHAGVYSYNSWLKWSSVSATLVYIVNVALSASIIFGYFYDGYQSVIQFIINVTLCISILYRGLIHSRVDDIVISNTLFIPLVYNQVDKNYASSIGNIEIDSMT